MFFFLFFVSKWGRNLGGKGQEREIGICFKRGLLGEKVEVLF